ncbi:hypothetical protein OG453_03445 [Streptomyces sp. NBC_01381]|uniref:hypothetical protein n=1 Tax=Streptomyces sp. NBC_01381 TaxID=2903845 RepID=UPI00224DA5BA|nr:hypothetical protein [Streptomyces sp. NBC_01381]MCX4665738.1 hypothetical protein [Streptomyces sp. NBC_01381]
MRVPGVPRSRQLTLLAVTFAPGVTASSFALSLDPAHVRSGMRRGPLRRTAEAAN